MTSLLSQDKIIYWLTKQISKYESLNNNNKEVKSSKEEEQNIGREINMITSQRMKEFIILTMISSKGEIHNDL